MGSKMFWEVDRGGALILPWNAGSCFHLTEVTVLRSRKPNPRLELYAERQCGVQRPPARLVHPRWQDFVNHCGLEALLNPDTL